MMIEVKLFFNCNWEEVCQLKMQSGRMICLHQLHTTNE